MPNLQLLADVLLSGLLLGGLYGAISVGFSLCFGLVNVVNIAHPSVVMLGAYAALALSAAGLDPVLAGLAVSPAFAVAGYLFFRGYAAVFEARGLSQLSGMTFFFGLMFVLEVGLSMTFGADYRLASGPSVTGVVPLGAFSLPLRLLTPFLVGVGVTVALALFLRLTFTGQALAGVAQDELAIRLVGASAPHVKAVGFAAACWTAAIAGSLLVAVAPVHPTSGREFIGRVFAVAVLGGVGSPRGALAAGILLGVVENLIQTFAGASWAVATGFAMLLLALAFRPKGLFAR